MFYVLTSPLGIRAMTEKLIALKTVATSILASQGLKEVMISTLAIGNALNSGTKNGGAHGFRLNSLLKLSETKSTDGNATVMDYLVQVLYDRSTAVDVTGDESIAQSALEASAALRIDSDLSIVSSVTNVQLTGDCVHGVCDFEVFEISTSTYVNSDLLAEVNSMKSDQKKCQDLVTSLNANAVTIAEAFTISLETIRTELLNLDHVIEDCTNTCSQLTSFFGEEGSQVNSVIGSLSTFIVKFREAKSKHARLQKQKLRNR